MRRIFLIAALCLIAALQCFSQNNEKPLNPEFSSGKITLFKGNGGGCLSYDELRTIADEWALNPGFISIVIMKTDETNLGIQFIYLFQNGISFRDIMDDLIKRNRYGADFSFFTCRHDLPGADEGLFIIKQEKLP